MRKTRCFDCYVRAKAPDPGALASSLRYNATSRDASRRVTRLVLVVAFLAVTLLCPDTSWALEPGLPPGKNFDLSHWKLTLPVNSSNGVSGTAMEISATKLTAGYTNESFFYTATNGSMVFRCPAIGASTGGMPTVHPRTELREMLDPSNSKSNWTANGVHVLKARCAVNEMAVGCRSGIGQVHGHSVEPPLVLIRYDNSKGAGTVTATVKYHTDGSKGPDKHSDKVLTFGDVKLNEMIDYQIVISNGVASVTVNRLTQSQNFYATDPRWTNATMYFKAGNYYLDNGGGKFTNATQVSFYSLAVSHAAEKTADERR